MKRNYPAWAELLYFQKQIMGRRQTVSCEKATGWGGGGERRLSIPLYSQMSVLSKSCLSVRLYPAVAFPNLHVEDPLLSQQKEQQAATGANIWLWAAEQKPSSQPTSNLKQSYQYVEKEIHYTGNPPKYYQNYEWSTDICHSTMMSPAS